MSLRIEEENQVLRDLLARTRAALGQLMALSTCPNDNPEGTAEHTAEVAAYNRAYDDAARVLGVCAECGSDFGHRPTCDLASGSRAG